MNKKTIILGVFVFGIFYFAVASSANASTCTNLSSTLRYGSRGSSEVLDLQKFLFEKGYLSDNPTGFFGKQTQNAVKKFQLENGLPSTGLVASMTRAKISAMSCSQEVSKANPVSVVDTNNYSNVASAIVALPTPVVAPKLSLPYTTTNFYNWKTQEGVATSTPTGLQLNAGSDTTTALSSFALGDELTDYKVSAQVFVRRGSFILVSRFKDDKNYLACNFYGKSIDLVQMIDGEQTTLANIYLDDSPYNNFFFNDINVSMFVKGKTAGCTMMGGESNVTTNNIPDSLKSGTAGVKIWFDAPGVTDALVRSFKIENN